MASTPSSAELDRDVRLAIYRRLLENGRAPTHYQVAGELGLAEEAAASAFRRLADAHALVLQPGTLEISMANPLSAVPTDFRVATPRGEYFGNCIWDAFGVIAMLGRDGTISTQCPCCGDPMELRVEGGELQSADGVVHFAVPAGHWWDDIGYT